MAKKDTATFTVIGRINEVEAKFDTKTQTVAYNGASFKAMGQGWPKRGGNVTCNLQVTRAAFADGGSTRICAAFVSEDDEAFLARVGVTPVKA